jgi:predicted phage tail protein
MKIKKEVLKRILMEEIQRQMNEDALSSMTGNSNKSTITTPQQLSKKLKDDAKILNTTSPTDLNSKESALTSKIIDKALEISEPKIGDNGETIKKDDSKELSRVDKAMDMVAKQFPDNK